MKAAGCPREAIDIVVCTHLHVDHVGWNTMKDGDRWVPTFPNARYLIGRREYEYWSADTSEDQVPVMEDSVTPIFDSGLADLVEPVAAVHGAAAGHGVPVIHDEGLAPETILRLQSY